MDSGQLRALSFDNRVIRGKADCPAAIMLIGPIFDPVGDAVVKKLGATKSISPLQDGGPFIEHQHDVQNLLFGLPKGNRPMVPHKDELGWSTILLDERAERSTKLDRQLNSRIGIGDYGHIPTADHDRIRENMLKKRFGAELAGKNANDRNGMDVPHPFGAPFFQTKGMEKCFDRRKLCLGINPAVFQHFLHFLVAFVRLVQGIQDHFCFHPGEAATINDRHLTAGGLHIKGSVAQVGADVSFGNDGQMTIGTTQLMSEVDKAFKNG